jgi:glycosyltransferase involved in cell wall biosynthesis
LRSRHTSVLHVIEPAPFGGAESVVAALSRGALARGLPVAVAALVQDAASPPVYPALRAAGVPIHEIRCGRRHYIAEVRALARLLRTLRPDVVHTHVYHADIVGTVAARLAGVPSVATVHGFTGGDRRNRLYEQADLLALRICRRVLCVSEAAAVRVRASGVTGARVRVVPNGWAGTAFLSRDEARAQLGLGRDDAVVGWVGRLSAEKGPDLFVDAVLPLLAEGRRAVLVGDGPERDAIAARLAAGSRAGGVLLAGARPDAGTLMRAFDVLVLSSRTEGVPMVLLDAMAASVPVVATAVGGIPSVVDEATAWLVPAGDTGALGAAIRAVLEDAEAARRRTHEAARRCADRFGIERWLDEVYAVYDEVLG